MCRLHELTLAVDCYRDTSGCGAVSFGRDTNIGHRHVIRDSTLMREIPVPHLSEKIMEAIQIAGEQIFDVLRATGRGENCQGVLDQERMKIWTFSVPQIVELIVEVFISQERISDLIVQLVRLVPST